MAEHCCRCRSDAEADCVVESLEVLDNEASIKRVLHPSTNYTISCNSVHSTVNSLTFINRIQLEYASATQFSPQDNVAIRLPITITLQDVKQAIKESVTFIVGSTKVDYTLNAIQFPRAEDPGSMNSNTWQYSLLIQINGQNVYYDMSSNPALGKTPTFLADKILYLLRKDDTRYFHIQSDYIGDAQVSNSFEDGNVSLIYSLESTPVEGDTSVTSSTELSRIVLSKPTGGKSLVWKPIPIWNTAEYMDLEMPDSSEAQYSSKLNELNQKLLNIVNEDDNCTFPKPSPGCVNFKLQSPDIAVQLSGFKTINYTKNGEVTAYSPKGSYYIDQYQAVPDINNIVQDFVIANYRPNEVLYGIHWKNGFFYKTDYTKVEAVILKAIAGDCNSIRFQTLPLTSYASYRCPFLGVFDDGNGPYYEGFFNDNYITATSGPALEKQKYSKSFRARSDLAFLTASPTLSVSPGIIAPRIKTSVDHGNTLTFYYSKESIDNISDISTLNGRVTLTSDENNFILTYRAPSDTTVITDKLKFKLSDSFNAQSTGIITISLGRGSSKAYNNLFGDILDSCSKYDLVCKVRVRFSGVFPSAILENNAVAEFMFNAEYMDFYYIHRDKHLELSDLIGKEARYYPALDSNDLNPGIIGGVYQDTLKVKFLKDEKDLCNLNSDANCYFPNAINSSPNTTISGSSGNGETTINNNHPSIQHIKELIVTINLYEETSGEAGISLVPVNTFAVTLRPTTPQGCSCSSSLVESNGETGTRVECELVANPTDEARSRYTGSVRMPIYTDPYTGDITYYTLVLDLQGFDFPEGVEHQPRRIGEAQWIAGNTVCMRYETVAITAHYYDGASRTLNLIEHSFSYTDLDGHLVRTFDTQLLLPEDAIND